MTYEEDIERAIARKLEEKIMHGLTGGGEQIRICDGNLVYCRKDCPRCLVKPIVRR